MKKILMVVTSNDKMGDADYKTGLYLSELTHPYDVFKEAGFAIDVASPKGGIAPIDTHSLSEFDGNPYEDITNNTLKLNHVSMNDYDAIFLVGGHGVMWDFPDNQTLQNLVKEAYHTGKAVAAVCHGPAGLVNVTDTAGNYLFKGKKMTSFTAAEEATVNLTTIVPFLLEEKFKQNEVLFEHSDVWQEHVVVDGQLITGQNPASAAGVGRAVVKCLSDSDINLGSIPSSQVSQNV